MNSFQSDFTIRNTTGQKQKLVVNTVVTDQNGQLFLQLPEQKRILKAGENQRIHFESRQLQPQLWSPEHPTLYTVKTSVKINDEEVIADTRKIGFKSFEIRGHLFYLNGNPYFLRALSQWPDSRITDENGKSAPEVWSDESFVKRFFEKAKALHINAGRIGNHELWLKYADEMGFLNIDGSYSHGKDTSVFQKNKDIFTPKILKLRNHVSTAIYTIANEIVWDNDSSFVRRGQKNYEFAKTLDPTHPIIGNAGFGNGKVGDIEDIHDYIGWYGGTILDMIKFEENDFYYKDGGSKQPVTFTECVGTYTGRVRDNRFELFLNKGLSNALRCVGRGEQHPEDPLAYQRLITKELMEGMRRARGIDNRICASFPFSNLWIWDVPGKSFMAKPAAEILRQVYSPVLLSMKCWDRHAFAGGEIKGDLYIVNDDMELGDLTSATATVRLVQNDRTLVSLDYPVPTVDYYATAKIPVNIPVPDEVKNGKAKVILTLNHGKARSVSNDMDVFIAQSTFAKNQSLQAIPVYDPSGNTIQALKNRDVNIQVVQDILSGDNRFLIIGAGALKTLSKQQVQAVLSFADNGGNVLVLEQNMEDSSLFPEGVKLKTSPQLFVNTERPGILDKGMANMDFFLWNSFENVSGYPAVNVFDIRPEVLNKTAVLANCGYALDNPVVLEYFKGKGTILFSQFELIGRANTDPIAAKVLVNLIDYLQADHHTLGMQLKEDVIFSDLDSEAGLFGSSFKQGIVINSHNYGNVSWKNENAEFPDGRRVVGEQKVINGLGYISPVESASTAKGFFYFRPPAGAEAFYLEVKNPVAKQLWFKVYLNDKPAGEIVTVDANITRKYGSWQIPENNGDLKITLETQSDPDGLGYEKPIIEELVFQKMIFICHNL
jgi:hypothetical protein